MCDELRWAHTICVTSCAFASSSISVHIDTIKMRRELEKDFDTERGPDGCCRWLPAEDVMGKTIYFLSLLNEPRTKGGT